MTENQEFPFISPKSQKARGVMLLPLFFSNTPKHVLYQKGMSFEYIQKELGTDESKEEVFARPCPVRPRHGFVESRVISSNDDLDKIIKETKKADSLAELIFSRKMHSTHSAVLTTDGVLCIGLDHDGATSGRNAVQLMVAPVNIPDRFRNLCKVKENGYIEAVSTGNAVVQFRDGPPQTSLTNNFIPFEVVVKDIVEPCEDLLEWEEKAKTLPKGTVVYGKGHGLTSHAAVHCVINNVPFLSFLPKIGDVLVPEVVALDFNLTDFRIGMSAAYELENGSEYESLPLYLFHCWPRLQYDKNASKILGYIAAKIRLMACRSLASEARYKLGEDKRYVERSIITSETKDTGNIHELISSSAEILSDVDNFNFGYGGPKWLSCVNSTIELNNAIVRGSQAEILRALNFVINQSHNSGLFLDKLIPKHCFDLAAKNPALGLFECQPELYKLLTRDFLWNAVFSNHKIIEKNKSIIVCNLNSLESVNHDSDLPKHDSEFMKMLGSSGEKWRSFKKQKDCYVLQSSNLTFRVF